MKLGYLDLPSIWISDGKSMSSATAPGSVAGLRWPGHGRRTAGLLGEASTNQMPSSSSLHQSEASYCHVGDCHWSTVHSPLSRTERTENMDLRIQNCRQWVSYSQTCWRLEFRWSHWFNIETAPICIQELFGRKYKQYDRYKICLLSNKCGWKEVKSLDSKTGILIKLI